MPRRRRTSDDTVTQPTRKRLGSERAASHSPDDFPVVGIGASAGGLDAFQKLFDALPSDSGMAFILVQHLDPTHESLMVELLAKHTTMRVQHATDGMRLEPNRVYVIPPGVYLSVGDGALRLSRPLERHGARLPFDFLLRSLAEELGERAVCIVLSGTGADGSLGLKAVKEQCGLVIAQDPDEAGYDGMPQSAIMTGAVDLVLPVAKVPEALITYQRRMALARTRNHSDPEDAAQDWLPEIIDLLRSQTPHDFTLYKPGTLRRRIERRIAMAAIDSEDVNGYLDVLRSDPSELEFLAKELLINVTGFFRDPKVFNFLGEKVAPDLVGGHSTDNPLRIWVVGCSTGEEAYSLAMVFHEKIAAAKRNVRLQIFASDIDPDAVASAREGLYPETIEADVSPERLAHFFTKEDQGYRVSPELRAAVVFTVQDVLVDPPFARLDLISCRNLLIYLQPAAQAKVISLFHFALREGGLLLLGNAETVGNADDRFEAVSGAERLYRHIGRSRPGEFGHFLIAGAGARLPVPAGQAQAPSPQAALADLCQRLVLETHAPAAVLINCKHECLYLLGPTDRYLRVGPGQPTHDVLAMAREGVRTKLRTAIQQAGRENARVVIGGGRTRRNGDTLSFSIDIQPVQREDEDLLLICFVEEPKHDNGRGRPGTPRDASRVADLEQELEATRTELESAVRDLERSTDEQKAIAEETLSVNEEFQATNEELLTSKEELQSLNEELTALNSQLQETLERQRTTANDLQNILYSTDVATLFLDTGFNIRFFTPAVKSFFHVIPEDVGRPLADLNSLAADGALLADAQTVLRTLAPIEREVEAQSGAWYVRRTLPYRTQDNRIEGIVITYTDITERKRTADALEAAKRQAEQANIAKSRFLSAASHDLRQPLQTLTLLQGVLAKTVEGEKAQQLVALLGETSAGMSGMLHALLDVNQLEAGVTRADVVDFQVSELFDQLKDEFTYYAAAQGLALRVVPCSQSIHSDPRLLEQMIRNLLSNALKYTRHGKVLLGCRHRPGTLSIEVWDTGIGIPGEELQRIFEEYHRIDNDASTTAGGLGLGLSIVQRLADLLGHRMRVHSQPGKGSMFAIEITLAPSEALPQNEHDQHDVEIETSAGDAPHRTGVILVIEDDPDIRSLLDVALKNEGHHTVTAPDAIVALETITKKAAPPELIIADYNLPGGMDGLQFIVRVREKLDREIPAIILTGDISTDTLRDIGQQDCIQLNKPVKFEKLARVIQDLLRASPAAMLPRARKPAAGIETPPVVYVVDDDRQVLEELRRTIGEGDWPVEAYSTAEAFLEAYRPDQEACLLVDAYLPGMNGLELLQQLMDGDHRLTAIMITGHGDVQMAVKAMKAGASDFIEKPIGRDSLLASVEHALQRSSDAIKQRAWKENAARRLASLTQRQRQIMEMILAGHPNKNIAADLNISQRTVENHRAAIMKKTGSKSLPALVRLALAAAEHGPETALSNHGDPTDRP